MAAYKISDGYLVYLTNNPQKFLETRIRGDGLHQVGQYSNLDNLIRVYGPLHEGLLAGFKGNLVETCPLCWMILWVVTRFRLVALQATYRIRRSSWYLWPFPNSTIGLLQDWLITCMKPVPMLDGNVVL